MSRARVLLVVVALGLVGAALWLRHQRLAHAVTPDPRFVTLGGLARALATEKQPFDAVLDRLGANVAFLSDTQRLAMRKTFELGDFEALDQLPKLDLPTLEAGLAVLATRRPLALPAEPTPVALSLGAPRHLPLTGEPFQTEVGLGLLYGDRLDAAKAANAGEALWLASRFEALSLGSTVDADGTLLRSPEDFFDWLTASGHTVEVVDERLWANFGDLERAGKPVATPLWVDTGATLHGAKVYLPVPHAQLAVHVEGPYVTASVTLYPSLDLAGTGDGGARFRPDLTRDQVWCGRRVAHTYRGPQAREALKWMGRLRRAWDEKVRSAKLPLDGYFALGVCTLAPAVVERAVLGTTTVWPLTHEPKHFQSADELDRLVAQLPSDSRGNQRVDVARLRGSIPFETVDDVTLASLRESLSSLAWMKPARP